MPPQNMSTLLRDDASSVLYRKARNYSSKAATFTAPAGINKTRQITGLDGPSASAAFMPSFPQPEDADDEDQDDVAINVEEVNNQDGDAADDTTPKGTKERTGDKSNFLLKPHSIRNSRSSGRSLTRAHDSKQDKQERATSFVTARTKPKAGKSRLSLSNAAASPPQSFQTAREPAQDPHLDPSQGEASSPGFVEGNASRSSNGDSPNLANGTNSTTALLPDEQTDKVQTLQEEDHNQSKPNSQSNTNARGLVRFNLDNKADGDDGRTMTKISKTISKSDRRMSWRRLRQGQVHPGEIVKAEKMLVRVDSTMHELPPDYDENGSQKIEARTVDKWREYVVVCRESTSQDADFALQMYKTRVIPAKEQTHVRGKSSHEISLAHRTTKINMYSSLDKTLILWTPWKGGIRMYILHARSAASAVEWYTFLRQTLGWTRSTHLQINVPDLSVSLQLEKPFSDLERSMSDALSAKSEKAAMKTMEAEKAAASSIIQNALKALEDNPEWSNVLEKWLEKEKIGLAWKRYDRLEWVHGANEQRMYGTLAMQKTHELELRPKDHYPTEARKAKEVMREPAPVEGFLVRLTSQKGNVRRLGKMYYKRLYFTTHNQYFCYCRPARAQPPPPPSLPEKADDKIPSASELVDNSPLIFAVNPFPEHNGQIDWLKHNASVKAQHDEAAHKESERKVNSLLQAEGYVNLLHVSRVQNATRGNSVADPHISEGSDVDFHQEVLDTPRDDGKVSTFDDDRTFELVMKNKLVIRLQAYDEQTKREWIHRLRKLVHYWKLRLADDMELLKFVRAQNLDRLGIDEEMEASLGQFGSKWEVSRSIASPKLFHMCGISCCRAITLAGTLYHKPKRRSTFLRSGVILCHGKLLVFHGTVRKRTGEEVRHIQHDRHSALDLKNCYVYSGLLTEGDMLYENRTFDSNHPGHHALPRVWVQDGWTSIDEDVMTTFVIWQPRNKSWLRASPDDAGPGKMRQRLRHVSRLGVPGRSIVFRARSRAERDHWVMSIGMEIDRLSNAGEDIRVVD
ncbi:uncharacterized protein KY384_008761 [Bacidia gigantensis]|uniref:uncharacterized protein n=1 Tax=Bacidia gigantensis TaxID=2732470 RepID=UPI001D03C367|nr:uncharacterized protein KY384_008761 [Bacidia gigantensis]KAG8526560.1 hypothetical protein KY384_008761 [Bacidia gigantensis]